MMCRFAPVISLIDIIVALKRYGSMDSMTKIIGRHHIL